MVLLGLKLLMKMLLVQMKPQSILLTGRNFALDAAQLNDWSLRHVDYCGHFDGHLSAMYSVNHHDVAEEIHFPWTLLDGALTRNLVKKFDRQRERKSFLKHTDIRAKLLLCFVEIAFLEKMAGYSRMAVSSTGACKRRVFPSIHLRSMSSSRVVGCLAFRVCCVHMLITCQYVLSTGGICLWQSKTFCNSSFTVRHHHHHHHHIWNSCSSFLEIGFHSVRGELVWALKLFVCTTATSWRKSTHQ